MGTSYGSQRTTVSGDWSSLHADSLELRRLRYDLTYTYKVVFRLVNGAASDFFTLTSLILHSSGMRGHTYKLFPHGNRVDLYKYFFSQRIIDTWNNLPAKLNDFSSLARFTRFVRSADLSHFYRSGTNRSRFLVVFNILCYFVHQRLLVPFGLGVVLSCRFVCLCLLPTVLCVYTESFK